MKVTLNKCSFTVKPEKNREIYDLGDYISDGMILMTKERISNLSELVFSEIKPPNAENVLKPLETIFDTFVYWGISSDFLLCFCWCH